MINGIVCGWCIFLVKWCESFFEVKCELGFYLIEFILEWVLLIIFIILLGWFF